MLDGLPGGPHEIIFVDDGSTDRTYEVLETALQRNPRMVVLSLSVYAVTDLIRDPLNVVIVLLILISIEVTVFILFSYRHAKSFDETEKDEANLLAKKREKVKKDLEEWKRRNNL